MARIVPILSTTALLVACFAIVGCGSESLAGAPVAGDDRAITGRDTPIVLPLLVNDEATSPSTLDVGSLDLDPAAAGIQQHRTTEAGDYLLDCLGDVRFVPTPGFRGRQRRRIQSPTASVRCPRRPASSSRWRRIDKMETSKDSPRAYHPPDVPGTMIVSRAALLATLAVLLTTATACRRSPVSRTNRSRAPTR